MSTSPQVARIQSKLQAARQKDPAFALFGANHHHYALGEPLSAQAIADFEAKNAMQFPAQYKTFLSEVGNGGPNGNDGAGPYCGLVPLGGGQHYMGDVKLRLARPCTLSPTLSEAEWYERARFFEEDPYGTDEFWECYYSLFDGLLPLGTEAQRGTYIMMLVLNGPDIGKIVTVDIELQKPFFHPDAHFLDWYERWLDELLAGYDTGRFSYVVYGGADVLLEKAAKAKNPEGKRKALLGLVELSAISSTDKEALQAYCNDAQQLVRHAAITALFKFDRVAARPYLVTQWSLTDADRRFTLRLIQEQGPAHFGEWVDVILPNLAAIQDHQLFRLANTVLNGSGADYGDALLPFLNHPNDEFQTAAIHFLGVRPEKGRYLEAFKTALASDNYKVVATALYSVEGLQDESLMPLYGRILDKFADNQYIQSDLLNRLEDIGEPARGLLEKATTHPLPRIAQEAQQILEGLGK